MWSDGATLTWPNGATRMLRAGAAAIELAAAIIGVGVLTRWPRAFGPTNDDAGLQFIEMRGLNWTIADLRIRQLAVEVVGPPTLLLPDSIPSSVTHRRRVSSA
jgi:hypothetical protein